MVVSSVVPRAPAGLSATDEALDNMVRLMLQWMPADFDNVNFMMQTGTSWTCAAAFFRFLLKVVSKFFVVLKDP